MTTALAPAPTGIPPHDALWWHEDPGGISPAAERGVARALSSDWASKTISERVADFRGWLVYRAWLESQFGGYSATTDERQGAMAMAPDFAGALAAPPENERARVVRLLGKTPILLARAAGSGRPWEPPQIFKTVSGAPASDDTGALPLIAVAIVTVVVAVAESAAVAYLAHEARGVIENYLARDASLKELAQTDAQTLKILDAHAAHEKDIGAPAPLSDAEKRALDALESRQGEAEKRLGKLSEPQTSGGPWWLLPVSVAAAVAAAIIFGK